MVKKLASVAMRPQHPDYQQAVARLRPLYNRDHDIRSPFSRDYTRIIFSPAYRRLKNKTQVFFAVDNDHICTRNDHVNLVGAIAHTIGDALGLNTELTQAIAAGHDLGHAPFGHGGEAILNTLAKQHGLEGFWHERNSLHFCDEIELLEDDDHLIHNLNLTYAVRDGIISHCGEVSQQIITPRKDAIDLQTYHRPGLYQPYTYEGCLVKMCDKIAYLARDIEDGLTLGIITEAQVADLRERLNHLGGQFKAITNGTIVNYFIHDVINASSLQGIALSSQADCIMKEIMNFNYRNIYVIKRVQVHANYVSLIMSSLFDFLYDYGQYDDMIARLKKDQMHYPKTITHYLSWLEKYAAIPGNTRSPLLDNVVVYDFGTDAKALEKSIIDYLAGMTDTFLIAAFNELLSF